MSSSWGSELTGAQCAKPQPWREDHARARLLERLDRGVGVLRRVEVVRPVEQRRDAAVERLERADQVAGVGVLGAVELAHRAVQAREVVRERPVGADVAEERLPGVAVRVDQARHDDAVGRVDDLGVAGVEVRARRPRSRRSRSGRRRVSKSPTAGSTEMTVPPLISVRWAIAPPLRGDGRVGVQASDGGAQRGARAGRVFRDSAQPSATRQHSSAPGSGESPNSWDKPFVSPERTPGESPRHLGSGPARRGLTPTV